MKKKYEKPKVYSEDISTAFVGACCGQEPQGANPLWGGFCPGCTYVTNSYPAGG